MRYIKTVNKPKTLKNFASPKQYFIDTCELFLSMLCTELDLDPKIKVLTLVKYYNFILGCTAMQTIYSIV